LEQAVAEKEFREDLFYRLNVVRIQLPPLRERREDIRLLVNYFSKKFAQSQKQRPKSISAETLRTLEQYHWPGNVRELENVIQRAMVMAKGEAILLSDLPAEIFRSTASSPPAILETKPAAADTGSSGSADLASVARALFQWARQDDKRKVIPAVERELIIQALAETNGNQVRAAKLLGITRATLRKRVEKFSIKKELSIR